MPCLNSDILFEIGKKLVKNGDSDVVFRFTHSGKENFKAMKEVFASTTTLKLYYGYYVVGWGEKCSTFEIHNDNPKTKLLLLQIGTCIKDLHIDYFYSVLQPIIDRIVARKQLVSFSAGYRCDIFFLEKFLPSIVASVKDVTIPNNKMSETFRDTLKLKTLTILESDEYLFSKFCCKTETLEIRHSSSTYYPIKFQEVDQINPFLASVKHLIINRTDSCFHDNEFDAILKHFYSLELLQCEINHDLYPPYFQSIMNLNIRSLKVSLNRAAKVPCKASFSFKIGQTEFFRIPTPEKFMQLFYDFEYDESINEYYCFRKIIHSAGTETTNLEVKIFY